MIDGFHWTRVTAKQLRFLYEAVTLTPAPPHMCELAARIDQSSTLGAPRDAAVRNSEPPACVYDAKEHSR